MQTQNNYNPDVLSCLANLSSDEVFTPPKLANEILDLLPKGIWKDKNATFLDPVCKSGVFLREIAKRLLEGLKDEIPNTEKRIEHIYKNQIFGIGITGLTSLLSRRSLYCSKLANGKYSITSFEDEKGNIFFDKTNHDWQNGRCSFCGASQSEYEREEGLESHAYQFIHNNVPDKIKNMKFDVIIGNPPYQLNVGVEQKNFAIAIYQKFVEQAIKLNPRFLTMIVPARWYAGGRGLDEFRSKMLKDERITNIHDYPISSECFPGVEIKGGVCYFLWERDNPKLCNVVTHKGNKIISEKQRPLLEDGVDSFIRYNESISILHKLQKDKNNNLDKIVSVQTPFGIITSFKDYKKSKFDNSVKFYTNKEEGYINKKHITKNFDLLDKYKVYISAAYGAGEDFPHQILNKPFLGEPNSCCSQTYLAIGSFDNKTEAENLISYIKTKFFRFCVMLKKNAQHNMRDVFSLVPMQDFSESWTDEKLYKKYKLTKEEIEFIESMIRPMN
jgi:site-specific DNA-methyltransferase (adenine-specific)